MYGTPVVSSDVGGVPEFVAHKKTGYLLGADAKVEEWIDGINYARENFPALSRSCREYFVENFSGKNWDEYLDDLLC
jgi:glycosyltransferase involved in cell wall biosynthesis